MADSSGEDQSEAPEGDTSSPVTAPEPEGTQLTDLSAASAARGLFESVRREESPDPFSSRIAEAGDDDLVPVRTDRRQGLAFWLNVYNAGAQLLLERRPTLFESRLRFFRTPAVTVAGVDLSLDDIEHGVLRGGRSKYGLGYLPRVERTGLDRAYRIEVDPRIHFALNCGAASCPAVLAYDPDTVDETLDDATRSYLDETVQYDAERNRVRVPRFCLWFVGDFGGRSGIRELLREFEQIPPESSPSLRFSAYDWTKEPRRFEG
ncbi:DUF547 domain-containing protein [Natrinema sp. 1APR25-10V2]|uniref:DUF547 domain-containing protein n=1 Tax=Natrinema sp. 1APR25-10V2 TaxID=2951081 RepID=UPI002876D245|nr:DUF547 domain-containing protein [Natrinema sp. 1APR25-10V2]MDS0475524.1 DUF547 domain-containing protein [Natrinema sp. 1APR25-10V2]